MSEPNSDWLIGVDVGNNHVKLARLPSSDATTLPCDLPVLRMSSRQPDFESLADWLPATRVAWCVASVNRPVESLLSRWVASCRPADDYVVLANDQLPIEIRVENPQQVGTDRLLTALATAELRTSDRAAVVIDVGSAITVDLVSADGAFEGGAILPGFEMMANALAQQTDQLPQVEAEHATEPPPVVGKSTVQAIRSGLFWSHVGAVRELVQRIGEELGTAPEVFVAGGDAETLAPFLAPTATVVPNLIFQGLMIAYRHVIGSVDDLR